MVNSPKSKQKDAIRESLRIPTCKIVAFSVKEHANATDVRLSPTMNVGQQNSENSVQQGVCLGHGLEMNTPYVFEGRTFPQPKSQQAVILIDKFRLGEDSLNSYAPLEDDLEGLRIFQPSSWSEKDINDKLDSIYSDLETNVTRIFQRKSLHLVVDCTYHSPLVFNFDGQLIKGWVNSLIVGDSSQGKSETNLRLMEHYGLGERVECKNASIAGLLGGLQQLGNRWFVSWGVIPTHDRRLVVLEEIKGTDPEVLSKLTDMRSSGIAEIPKIEKRRAFARTRLIFVSNPRTGRPVSAYNFGVETISGLFEGLEDIRRFDIAIVVSSKDVDITEINKLSRNRPVVNHIYSKHLCRELILWAWIRTADEIHFDSDAVDLIMSESIAFSEKYSEMIPLVDRGTMRHKIARLSASLAARTFSTDSLHDLRIRKCHVQYVAKWLEEMYSSVSFGYLDFSKAQVHSTKIVEPALVKRRLSGMKYAKDLIENLLYADSITLNDFVDWCDVEKDIAQSLVSFLIRKRAIYRQRRIYRKTSAFKKILKDLAAMGLPEGTDEEEF